MIGALFTGIYMSAQGSTALPPPIPLSAAFRPKAISWVMAGGLLSAVVGPQLVKLTAEAMVVPFLGTYLAVIALNLVGVFLFACSRHPQARPAAAGAPQGRSRMELIRTPRIAVAVIVRHGVLCADEPRDDLVTAGRRRLRLSHFGCRQCRDRPCAGDVHAPSFFTGHLIARFGVEKVMALGLVILAGAGACRHDRGRA